MYEDIDGYSNKDWLLPDAVCVRDDTLDGTNIGTLALSRIVAEIGSSSDESSNSASALA